MLMNMAKSAVANVDLSTLKSMAPSADTLKSMAPSADTLKKMTPSADTLKKMTPSADTLKKMTPSADTLSCIGDVPRLMTNANPTRILAMINNNDKAKIENLLRIVVRCKDKIPGASGSVINLSEDKIQVISGQLLSSEFKSILPKLIAKQQKIQNLLTLDTEYATELALKAMNDPNQITEYANELLVKVENQDPMPQNQGPMKQNQPMNDYVNTDSAKYKELSEDDKVQLTKDIKSAIIVQVQEERNNEDNEDPLTLAVADSVRKKILLDDAFINALSVKIKEIPTGGAKKTKTRRKTRRKRTKTKRRK